MKILLSESVPKSTILVAQSEDDVRTLRILFNNQLIRYAFLFWKSTPDKPDYPKGYEFLKEHNALATVTIHSSDPILDMDKDQRRNQFLKDVEDGKQDEVAGDLLNLLDTGDDNG